MFEPRMEPPAGTGIGFVVHVRDDHVLIRRDLGTLPEQRRTMAGIEHHLGLLHGASIIGVDLTEADEPGDDDDHEWIHLRAAYARLDDRVWAIAGRAVQIATWDRNHRFCGRCGAETHPVAHERSRRCGRCDLVAYPRLSPAVIMLVERDDRVLLAHGVQFPRRFYSALAGFVEPGETLEEAVVREIREEVGIEVTDVRYFGSQPWPFPHQIMIGFTARWLRGEIDPDPDEIVDAGWFGRGDLPPVPPKGISIAGDLLESWRLRERLRENGPGPASTPLTES